MSKNASQSHESADRQHGTGADERGVAPGVTVRVRGRRHGRGSTGERGGRRTDAAGTAAPELRVPAARPAGGELLAYYRLRCIALEAAVDRLADDLERERRRFDEVLARYENILQERGAEGAVRDGRE
jgi:hypothetical protein